MEETHGKGIPAEASRWPRREQFHVDTAQPIIYVTSVVPHSSLENSAQARSHSCLRRGGGQRDSLETAATPESPLKMAASL